MQYWPYLVMPAAFEPVSRYQIAFAMLMFLGSPAWMGLLVLGTLAVAIQGPANFIRPDAGMALFVITLIMWFAPKIATVIDVVSRPQLRNAFGGAGRFIASTVTETIFFLMLSPIMWFGHTVFLTGLVLGRRLGWTAQARDDHSVPWSDAAKQLWPHTLLGWSSHPDPCVHGAGRHPLCAVHRGRPCAVGPARGRHVVAGRRARADACRHRRIAGRERAARSPAPARIAGDRGGGAADALMSDDERTRRGIERSLRIYYDDQRDTAAMDALYARFVQIGALVFDVGSHVGDRIAAFRRLGARVIACEPNPSLVPTLRRLYGHDDMVTLEPVAVGPSAGEIEMRINTDNPTVSTASTDFVKASQGAPGWEGQSWDKSIKVPVTTLDALIARHGTPAFIKIDVEGFEAEALAGLTQPVAALSFEFTTIQRDVARACVAHCEKLGYLRYNAALGESQALMHEDWQSADAIVRWLDGLPVEANSGDVYAVR